MKKSLLVLVVSLILCFGLVACGGTSNSSSTTESGSEENLTESQANALGDIETEDNLFDVTITIPKDLVGDTTQAQLDETAKGGQFHSATLNADGSATYTMSKKQHKAMLEGLRTSITKSLSEMVGSTDYPNVTDVKANDDFTEFTVTTKSSELTSQESFSVMQFYMYGGYYGIFSGKTPDNVHVDFVNANSGKIITSADSKNAG